MHTTLAARIENYMGDATKLGQEAYFRGDDFGLNPYDESDFQHDEWDDGYSQAAFGDTEHDIGN